MKKTMIFLLIIIMTINLTGCWDQKIYEQSGFVLQVGFESTSTKDMLISFTLPVVDMTARERTELIYSNADMLREFREKARKTSAKVVEGGKIQQFLIEDSLASKGITNFFEVIERDSTDPPTAYVLITEGSPKEMFEALQGYGDKPAPAFYIHDLIRSNIKSSYIPEARIFQFSTLYFSPGIDPVAPIIKHQTDKGKGVEVTGTALFSGDKFVGKIDTKETPFLLAMMGKMKRSVFISKKVQEKEPENIKKGCAISITKAKRKLSVDMLDNKPKVNISLNLNATIVDFKWNKMYDSDFEQYLEGVISAEIKDICEKILEYTQEVGSDPIGIGDIIRAKHNNYWESVNWENAYKDVVFNVDVNVNIMNHGVIR
jgi:spore germination protein